MHNYAITAEAAWKITVAIILSNAITVMVVQREALAVTTNLLTRFICFALPGFKLSTLGSVSSNPAFYH
jgi:hypothetical protein